MPRHKKKPAPRVRHVQVELTLPMSLSEPLSDLLWELGTLGVIMEDDETRARPYDPTIPKTGLATVRGTFQHEPGLEQRVLSAMGPILRSAEKMKVRPELAWTDVPDKDWNTEWKKQWKPMLIGRGIHIVPTWEKKGFKVPRGGQAIYMDPGMAFGTGTHETTQLCTAELERTVARRKIASLLDVGTGSGILAIVAAKLARRKRRPIETLVGIDIDKDAVRTAGENAALNGVDLDTSATPVDRVKGTYDVVVANILLEPLLGMKDALLARLAPDGDLVLSGILEKQRPALEAGFTPLGLRVADRQVLGEWACVRFTR